jgi:hypothetical protein
MAGTSETAIANGRLVKTGGFACKFVVKLAPLWGVRSGASPAVSLAAGRGRQIAPAARFLREELSTALRTARVAAPVRIVTLESCSYKPSQLLTFRRSPISTKIRSLRLLLK